MKNRFQIQESELADRLLDRAETLKLTIHRFGGTTEAHFELQGSVGVLRDEPCPQSGLAGAFGLLADDDEEPCSQEELNASRQMLCDLLGSFVEGGDV